MHEMSICEAIIQTLEDQAKRHAYAEVKRVRVEIGPLSCVDTHALSFAFDACSRGTLADGAILDIVETDGAAWCFPCGKTVPISRHGDACPQCGSHQLQVTGGDELKIKDMEVA